MFEKQREKYYAKENERLNEELKELKFQYELGIDELSAKKKQAEDLIRQLTMVMAHVKKQYKKELESYEEQKNGK